MFDSGRQQGKTLRGLRWASEMARRVRPQPQLVLFVTATREHWNYCLKLMEERDMIGPAGHIDWQKGVATVVWQDMRNNETGRLVFGTAETKRVFGNRYIQHRIEDHRVRGA